MELPDVPDVPIAEACGLGGGELAELTFAAPDLSRGAILAPSTPKVKCGASAFARIDCEGGKLLAGLGGLPKDFEQAHQGVFTHTTFGSCLVGWRRARWVDESSWWCLFG